MAIDIAASRTRLLEVDPDLGRFLSREELSEARRVAVPLLTLGTETDALDELLREHRAFAALLLDGMVLEQVQIGDQVGMRLLGPGEIVSLTDGTSSMLVGEASVRAIPRTSLALLGHEFLLAARRWPGLIPGLNLRSAEQAERLATHLVICQLPRVDQRLLALMWLLAESWGRVTPTGTNLPLKLTHDALGALIGARRPTVTLALRDLCERGAIVRQDQGWLLLERAPEGGQPPEGIRAPRIEQLPDDDWTEGAMPPRDANGEHVDLAPLSERMVGLRARYETDRAIFNERLSSFVATRERCQANRARVRKDRLTQSRLPSS
jgi:CRP/FNR family transcriptional regulator, cyclic AMP receptor protein